jgi:putative DNA primase/helicase
MPQAKTNERGLAATNDQTPENSKNTAIFGRLDADGNRPHASIDLSEAGRFLTLLADDEAVTFQTFDDDAGRKAPALATVLHGHLDTHAARLKSYNERGAGIFWCVNVTDGAGRRTENITGVRAVFLDLDGAPLQPVLAAGVDPHAVVESSPCKWHVYWMVTGCQPDQFKAAQTALAAKFGGDPSVSDLPRVMRLPGFVHRKGEPFTTRIQSTSPMQPYDFGDLVVRLGLDLMFVTSGDKPRKPRVDPDTGEIHERVAEGGRHAHLVKWAAQMNWRGMPAEAVRVAVQSENLRMCTPPKAEVEVDTIVDDILRRYQHQHGQDRGARVAFRAPAEDLEAADVQAPGEWPDPILPGRRDPPELSADLLPGWVGAMADAVARATQTPPALAVMVALAVLATTVQRRFEVSPFDDDYTEPLALWTLTALPSGTRKTAVINAMAGPLVTWEKLQRDRMRDEIAKATAARLVAKKCIERLLIDAGKAKDASERKAIEAEIKREELETPDELRAPRLFTGDCTAERMQGLLVEHGERMTVMSDEPGIFLIMAGIYSGGVANLDVWLQGHAGAPFRVDRGTRMGHVDKPALSMCLAIQPAVMAEVAGGGRMRGSGALARFLFAMPPSNVGQRDVRLHRPVPEHVRDEYQRRVHDLLQGWVGDVTAPTTLRLAPDARECWLDLADKIEKLQGAGGKLEAIADWTSKLPGATARIAAVLALAEHGQQVREVPLASMDRAVRLATLLVAHARTAFALLGADGVDADAAAVLKWVQAGGLLEFTRRECQKAMEGRFRSVERLKKATERLESQDVLRERKRPNKGAPPTTFFQVNPKVHQ